jgi:hypothetical protein
VRRHGSEEPPRIVDEIAARFRRAQAAHAAAGRASAAAIFAHMTAWMARHAPVLRAPL